MVAKLPKNKSHHQYAGQWSARRPHVEHHDDTRPSSRFFFPQKKLPTSINEEKSSFRDGHQLFIRCPKRSTSEKYFQRSFPFVWKDGNLIQCIHLVLAGSSFSFGIESSRLTFSIMAVNCFQMPAGGYSNEGTKMF